MSTASQAPARMAMMLRHHLRNSIGSTCSILGRQCSSSTSPGAYGVIATTYNPGAANAGPAVMDNLMRQTTSHDAYNAPMIQRGEYNRVFGIHNCSSLYAVSASFEACKDAFCKPSKGAFTPDRARWYSAAAAAAANVEVPSMGDSITEGAIASVLKSVGDSVEVDEIICQIETDKVTIDVKAPVSGVLKEILVKEEDTVVVGQTVATVEEGAVSDLPKKTVTEIPSKTVESSAEAKKAPESKPVKVEQPKVASESSQGTPAAYRSERIVPMKRMRKRVAERLKDAQNTYAMLSTFNEVDMTNITAMRSNYKDAFFQKHEAKLGFMSCFVKAAAFALKEIPAVNGVIDGDNIIYRDYCDISIAVATPKGLVVPVLRNVETMDFASIEKNIASLGAKAREGTISIDDMAGGTFTISNGGVYGSLLSTPIINPPQSAILGMHSIVDRPVAIKKNGVTSVEVRPMMYIALTYDHRLIDGREAVTFLRHIKAAVEDPNRLLLDI